MAGNSDRALSLQVTQKLAMRGLRTPCRIVVSSQNGDVTLTGSIQFAHQRSAATQAAANVPGVRRVVDQLKVTPVVKR
jgi:osmotically-inducible protein OsmY